MTRLLLIKKVMGFRSNSRSRPRVFKGYNGCKPSHLFQVLSFIPTPTKQYVIDWKQNNIINENDHWTEVQKVNKKMTYIIKSLIIIFNRTNGIQLWGFHYLQTLNWLHNKSKIFHSNFLKLLFHDNISYLRDRNILQHIIKCPVSNSVV